MASSCTVGSLDVCHINCESPQLRKGVHKFEFYICLLIHFNNAKCVINFYKAIILNKSIAHKVSCQTNLRILYHMYLLTNNNKAIIALVLGEHQIELTPLTLITLHKFFNNRM